MGRSSRANESTRIRLPLLLPLPIPDRQPGGTHCGRKRPHHERAGHARRRRNAFPALCGVDRAGPDRRRARNLRSDPRLRLRRLRRRPVRIRESDRLSRPHLGRGRLRLLEGRDPDQPSPPPAQLALPHARRRALRPRGGRAPRDERPAACAERRAAFRRAARPHGRRLAQRGGRGAVGLAPPARGIGGLGGGAQGRALRRLRHADAAVLRALRAQRVARRRVRDDPVLCARIDGEADARRPALRVAAARRLAARAAALVHAAGRARRPPCSRSLRSRVCSRSTIRATS